MQTTDDQGMQHGIDVRDVRLPSHTPKPVIESLIPSAIRMAGERETEGGDKGHPVPDLLTVAPSWAFCPLGWQAHAIDAWADHPAGVWIARCGYQLSGGTPLYDVPQGQQCASCAKWSPATKARTTTGQEAETTDPCNRTVER
jgi:hypothetical protein